MSERIEHLVHKRDYEKLFNFIKKNKPMLLYFCNKNKLDIKELMSLVKDKEFRDKLNEYIKKYKRLKSTTMIIDDETNSIIEELSKKHNCSKRRLIRWIYNFMAEEQDFLKKKLEEYFPE